MAFPVLWGMESSNMSISYIPYGASLPKEQEHILVWFRGGNVNGFWDLKNFRNLGVRDDTRNHRYYTVCFDHITQLMHLKTPMSISLTIFSGGFHQNISKEWIIVGYPGVIAAFTYHPIISKRRDHPWVSDD